VPAKMIFKYVIFWRVGTRRVHAHAQDSASHAHSPCASLFRASLVRRERCLPFPVRLGLLGVMATSLSGEYSWAVTLRNQGTSARIEAAPPPDSPTAEELAQAVAYESALMEAGLRKSVMMFGAGGSGEAEHEHDI
jgi:hypothetical protein